MTALICTPGRGEAELDVDLCQENLLLEAIGNTTKGSSAVEVRVRGAKVKVRNRAFTGLQGGRVVKMRGSERELALAISWVISFLCGKEKPDSWTCQDEDLVWGYADPAEKGIIHQPFAWKRILRWRQSGPFTDSLMIKHLQAGCWLPLWLAELMYEMQIFAAETPPEDENEHNAKPTALNVPWDEDEEMEDLDGWDREEMTRQLASFRQPGNSLDQYVARMEGVEYTTSIQLPDAMDIVIEGSAHLTVVIDTNVLVEKLSLLQQMCTSFQELSQQQQSIHITASIVVPSIVLAELDGLKKGPANGEQTSVPRRARQALRWLEEAQKGKDAFVHGQSALHRKKAVNAYRSVGSDVTNDDQVLFCGLFLRDQLGNSDLRFKSVQLLTDDRNLRLKAIANELGALGFEDAPCSFEQAVSLCLPPDMLPFASPSAEQQCSQVLEEPHHLPRTTSGVSDFQRTLPHIAVRPGYAHDQQSVDIGARGRTNSAGQPHHPDVGSPADQMGGSMSVSSNPRSTSHSRLGSSSDSAYQSSPSFSVPPLSGRRSGTPSAGHEALVRQVAESALVAQMLWKLQENEFWLQDPQHIVSEPLPWAADTALDILHRMWQSEFAELVGSDRAAQRTSEAEVKHLRRLLSSRRRVSKGDALEAAQLLHSVMLALGSPKRRKDDSPASGGLTWEQAQDRWDEGCTALASLVANEPAHARMAFQQPASPFAGGSPLFLSASPLASSHPLQMGASTYHPRELARTSSTGANRAYSPHTPDYGQAAGNARSYPVPASQMDSSSDAGVTQDLTHLRLSARPHQSMQRPPGHTDLPGTHGPEFDWRKSAAPSGQAEGTPGVFADAAAHVSAMPDYNPPSTSGSHPSKPYDLLMAGDGISSPSATPYPGHLHNPLPEGSRTTPEAPPLRVMLDEVLSIVAQSLKQTGNNSHLVATIRLVCLQLAAAMQSVFHALQAYANCRDDTRNNAAMQAGVAMSSLWDVLVSQLQAGRSMGPRTNDWLADAIATFQDAGARIQLQKHMLHLQQVADSLSHPYSQPG